MNIAGMIFVFLDKYYAIKGKWRIPEKVLFQLAIFGGTIGVYCAMKIFRHKTLHKRFMLGLPAIFLAQVAFVWWVYDNVSV